MLTSPFWAPGRLRTATSVHISSSHTSAGSSPWSTCFPKKPGRRLPGTASRRPCSRTAQLLAEADFDAVSICLPPFEHAPACHRIAGCR